MNGARLSQSNSFGLLNEATSRRNPEELKNEETGNHIIVDDSLSWTNKL